jgi:hypothetical protein
MGIRPGFSCLLISEVTGGRRVKKDSLFREVDRSGIRSENRVCFKVSFGRAA